MALHEKHKPSGTAPGEIRPLAPNDQVGGAIGPDPAEQATVAGAREGDRDCFRELVEQHQDRIFRLAMRTLRCNRQTAEDICQDVFLRAHRGLAGFDGQVRFGTWLHTIAMNACISEYRKQRTLKRGGVTLSLDAPIAGQDSLHIDPPSAEVDPGQRAEQFEFAAEVRRVVHELPEEFRDAVILRDMQDLSYEEIGEVLGVPAGTVRSRIHRGRVLLQDKLRSFR